MDDPDDNNKPKCAIRWEQIRGYTDGVFVESYYNFELPNEAATGFFGEEIFQKPGTEYEWHKFIMT
jgi:hypothetical protein